MKRIAFATVITGALLMATIAAAGDAMDLDRRQPRWVTVQAVVTLPGDPVPRLSEPALAWFEPGASPGRSTVRIPGREVERIFFADRRPVGRSFSDFVWVFDAESGHVISASFSGRIDEPVRVGPFESSARVSIFVSLSTRATGGYRKPRRRAGRTIVDSCSEPRAPDCTEVESVVYDRDSGWVRANGAVCAVWHAHKTLAFTSLGEARFQELDASWARGPAVEQARSTRVGEPSAEEAGSC